MGAASAAVKAATAAGIAAAMETTAMGIAASLPAGRICARDAAVIEAAGMISEACAARKSARWSVIEMIVIAAPTPLPMGR
jgi:hypothetical protein